MTDVDQTPSDEMSAGSRPSDLAEHSRTGTGAPALQRAITDHLRYSIGRPAAAVGHPGWRRAVGLGLGAHAHPAAALAPAVPAGLPARCNTT